MAVIIQIDLSDKSESFSLEDVVVMENPEGVSVVARSGKELGWRRKFFPWGEIRRIKEFKNAPSI